MVVVNLMDFSVDTASVGPIQLWVAFSSVSMAAKLTGEKEILQGRRFPGKGRQICVEIKGMGVEGCLL